MITIFGSLRVVYGEDFCESGWKETTAGNVESHLESVCIARSKIHGFKKPTILSFH